MEGLELLDGTAGCLGRFRPREAGRGHAGLGRNLDPGCQSEVSPDANLSANHASCADGGRAGDACLGSNHRAFTHDHVVGDLDEVVQFAALRITVLPKVARSMVVKALMCRCPRSRRCPSEALSHSCRLLVVQPKPSAPMTAPAWRLHR